MTRERGGIEVSELNGGVPRSRRASLRLLVPIALSLAGCAESDAASVASTPPPEVDRVGAELRIRGEADADAARSPGERFTVRLRLPSTWRGLDRSGRRLRTTDRTKRCRLRIDVSARLLLSPQALPDEHVFARLPDDFPALVTEGGGNGAENVRTAWRVVRRQSRPLRLVAIWAGSFPSASSAPPPPPQQLQELRLDLKETSKGRCRASYYNTGRLSDEFATVFSSVEAERGEP